MVKNLIPFIAVLIICNGSLGVHAEPLVLGVHPTRSPIEMERTFGRLARIIKTAIPNDVSFRTRNSYDKFITALNSQTFDMVLIHPFEFLVSDVQEHYLPIVIRAGNLQPVFVSLSPNFSTLEKLRGKTIAFPRGSSLVTNLGIRSLSDAGLSRTDYLPLEHKNFAACLQSVSNAKADACLTLPNSARDFGENYNISFHTIAKAEAAPHVALLINKQYAHLVSPIRQHLLSLNTTEEGRITLRLLLMDEFASLSLNDLEHMREHPFFIHMLSAHQAPESSRDY